MTKAASELPDVTMTTAFVEALPSATLRASALAWPGLAAAVHAVADTGRAAWPELLLAPDEFVGWVAGRLDGEDVGEQLAGLHVADLYLACACARGDARAIAAFETRFAEDLGSALSLIDDPRLGHDDLRQLVRGHLFVGTATGRPAIAQYGGRGPLSAWLKVTATRFALNAIRGKRPAVDSFDHTDRDLLPEHLRDPELAYLKETYRNAFRETFAEVIASLSARDRTLLRQSVVDGLGVRTIATMYGMHHSTVARHLADTKARLVELTREGLLTSLGLDPAELDSVVALVRSNLDLSLARVLSPAP